MTPTSTRLIPVSRLRRGQQLADGRRIRRVEVREQAPCTIWLEGAPVWAPYEMARGADLVEIKR